MQNSAKRTTTSSFSALAVGALLLAGTAQQASAQLIAYEGFNYAAGSTLETLNGGTGWLDAWDASVSGTDAFSTTIAPGYDYSDVSAAYAGLDSLASGNRARLDSATGTNATQDPVRLLSGGTIGNNAAATHSTWVSFIGQRLLGAAGTSAGANLQFRSSAGEVIAVGKHSNFGSDYWSIYTGGNATTTALVDAADQVATSTLSLLLLQIVHVQGANDQAFLWVNPDVSAGFGGLGAATASMLDAGRELSFDRLRLFSSTGTSAANDGAQLNVDEIRVGRTFDDVLPGAVGAVPEPSTYAVFGAAALAALGAIRRFRR